MSRRGLSLCFLAASMLPAIAFSQSFLSRYKGLPYRDSRYQGGPQKIPGRVLCAYYDLGGEGVAYHDSDPQNHGSGELNPADGSYLNEFRVHEGVDTSYTRFNRKPDPLTTTPSTRLFPCRPALRWLDRTRRVVQHYAVSVTEAGTYAADFLSTPNRWGTISVDVDGKDATGPLQITTTNDLADPLAWRQWQHWNLASQLFEIPLCFWIACDGIDGSKISTLGPNSGFAASPGRAAASSEAAEPNRLRSRSTRLPDIGPHRLRGQRRLEELPVVLHHEGLRKISGV
jgi:hypothetical protein